MAAGRSSQVFVTLDAMRGCAALAVVILHTRMLFGWGAHINAYLAVDFFFGLSGFVLCHAYRERLSGGLTALAFMRTRLIRLYPLYLLAFAIALAVAALDVRKGAISLKAVASIAVREAFLVPSAVNGLRADAFCLNVAAWSLMYELLINAVLVLVWRGLTIRRLQLLCVVSGSMMVLVALANHGVSVGWNVITMPTGIIRVTFSFFGGVLLYEVAPPGAGHRLRVHNDLASAALLATLFGLLMLSPSGLLHAALDLGAIFVVFPAMIHIGARLQPTGLWGRASLLLGAASYAVYILHVPVRNLLANLLALHPVEPSPLLGGAFLVGVTLLALLVDAVYDRPVRSWLTARFKAWFRPTRDTSMSMRP